MVVRGEVALQTPVRDLLPSGTGGFRSLVAFRPGTRSAAMVLTPSARGVDLLGLGLLRGLTRE